MNAVIVKTKPSLYWAIEYRDGDCGAVGINCI